VSVNPPVGNEQRVVLLLNQLVPVLSPPVETKTDKYSFVLPARTPVSPPAGPPGSSQTIVVPIQGVKAGTYLVRLQVDGAESVLATDVNGRFDSPRVTVS
jgi:hypothetical protein